MATNENFIDGSEFISKKLLKHVNALNRSLRSANTNKGLFYKGRSLAGGRHLINTFKAVKNDRVNDDRFRTIHVDPKVSAGFSIAIDCSGSMDSATNRWGGLGVTFSRWENIAMLLNSILPALDKKGVKSHCGLVDVIKATNETTYKGNLFEISSPSDRWREKRLTKLCSVYMSGGTHIATYAQTAIEMAERLETTQKIALFVTDGYCGSVRYLQSLKEQAENKGITLVGIGIGDVDSSVARSFPNGIYAKNGLKLGEHLLKHLAMIVNRGGVTEGVEIS